jgi:hypothetical protein
MTEAVSISETSVNFYQTARRNIPEDSHVHDCRHERLDFHLLISLTALSFFSDETFIVMKTLSFEVSTDALLPF